LNPEERNADSAAYSAITGTYAKKNHKKKEAGNSNQLPAKSMKKKKSFICNYSLLCTGNNIPRKCEQYVIQI
jgi:hypothetical protein